MSKLIQAFLSDSRLSKKDGFNFRKPLLSLIGSSSRVSRGRVFSSAPNLNAKNSLLADYLIGSLKFSKDKALSFSSSYSRTKSLEKPQEVVHFFKGIGFSDACIHSMARTVPHILFADVEKTLKPKVTFLQELGLCNLIFKNPFVLSINLDKTLMPSINLIKEVLESDGKCRKKEQVNDDLMRVLTRCSTIFYMTSRLQANILYLESHGVVRSQLSSLLLSHPRLFTSPKEKLEELISRAVAMDFDMGSRMLAHAIAVLSCASMKTLNGRFEVFRMFGFSMDELASMFRKSPHSFGLSEANLRRKLEFFLNNIKMNRSVIVGYPRILCCSLEERLIPRYNVVEILKSRGLWRSDHSLQQALALPEKQFLKKYVIPFRNDVEESLLADRGKLVYTWE